MPTPVSTISGCTGCPLRDRYPMAPFVPVKGGSEDLLILTDKASDEDGRTGEPLSGSVGRMIDTWFGNVKISRRTAHVGALIPCSHPSNLFPTESNKRTGARLLPLADAHTAVNYCIEAHLKPLLASRPWQKLLLFGDKTLEYLTGKKSLYDWGGSPLSVPMIDPERRIAIATMHPAKLMTDENLLPLVYADLKRSLAVPDEKYVVYPELESLSAFVDKPFALDIETDVPPTKIRMFSISGEKNTGLVVRWTDSTAEYVQWLMKRAKIIYGQNLIQFDLPHLRRHGAAYNIDPRECSVRDTMLMHHLIWPTVPHDLGTLGRQYLDKPFWKKWSAEGAPNNAEEIYACRDSDGTFQLGERLWAELVRTPRLKRLYEEVQVPLARICSLMTEIGVQTDPEEARKLVARAETVIAEKEALLPEEMRPKMLKKKRRIPAPEGTLTPPAYGKSGKPLKQKPVKWLYEDIEVRGPAPWRASAKTAKFLYDDLGLKKKLNAEGRVTTGKLALAQLFHATGNPQIEALRELRRWAARKNICTKLSETEIAKTLHVSFNVQGSEAGRLSCSGDEDKIQLQNQTEDLRVMFVPSRPGWVIFSCITPRMRVLTSDLQWKEAGTLKIGEELIGFDEHLKQRRLHPSKIVNIAECLKHCLRITTDRGVIDVSIDHPFLRKLFKKRSEWERADKLRVGDLVRFYTEPWLPENTFDAGWMAGFLDGEGYVHSAHGVGFGQNSGPVLQRALSFLEDRGYTYGINPSKSGCNRVVIGGRALSGMRILGELRPTRLLPKAEKFWNNTRIWGRHTAPAVIQKIERIGRQTVISLETETHTYIAEGFLSHNCDFSQMEARLAAWFAKDTARAARFDVAGYSEYKHAASVFLGVEMNKVKKEKSPESPYHRAKTIVLGTDRALGAKKISITNDIPEAEVRKMQAAWKSQIPATIAWQEETGNRAKRERHLWNPFGRRGLFYTSKAYTQGISFLPQSTGADVIFRSMIALMYERIEWPLDWVKRIVQRIVPLPEPARLLIQIHDELVGECPESQVAEVEATLKAVMEQPWPELDGLALPANFSYGRNWLEAGEG